MCLVPSIFIHFLYRLLSLLYVSYIFLFFSQFISRTCLSHSPSYSLSLRLSLSLSLPQETPCVWEVMHCSLCPVLSLCVSLCLPLCLSLCFSVCPSICHSLFLSHTHTLTHYRKSRPVSRKSCIVKMTNVQT